MATNYLYDEPDIGYDEICFFYDGGGYDSVCLAGPTTVFLRRGGDGTNSGKRKKKQNLPFINVFINVLDLEVNDEIIDFPASYIKFSGENLPIDVIVRGLQLGAQDTYVIGEIKQALENAPEIQTFAEFTSKTEGMSDEEIEAQNLEERLKATKIEIVEPFNPVKIKLELVEEEKITIKTSILKQND